MADASLAALEVSDRREVVKHRLGSTGFHIPLGPRKLLILRPFLGAGGRRSLSFSDPHC
jgi:hypothetical protein